jgi:glycosyltransferase involved in cell wall biosynthesis
MRIALITAHSPMAGAAAGSQPAQSTSLARALAGLGHRVTVYVRQESASCTRSSILGRGVSIEHVTAGPARPLGDDQAARYMPEFAACLSERWQVKEPDVVHAFSWLGGLAALGAARGTDIPVLQTFESLGSAECRHASGGDVSAARVRLEAAIGRAADVVLARSGDEAVELARLAVPKAHVRVIPCGIDTQVFGPEGQRAARGNRTRLVAVASSGEPRGLQAVVRALTQLPGTELVIAGGPDARHLPRAGAWRELARLAAALQVRNRVSFAGELDQAELAGLFRSADLLVSVSSYEPAGTAAIQAMACGTPVIVSGVGAHADAVVDGITGRLVAPEHPAMLAHRVRGLLARPVQMQALGIAAADRAQSRYSFGRVGRETAAAYEHCLRARSAALAVAVEEELADVSADVRGVAAFA